MVNSLLAGICLHIIPTVILREKNCPYIQFKYHPSHHNYIYHPQKYKLFVESVAIPDLTSRRPYAVASERSEEATYRA